MKKSLKTKMERFNRNQNVETKMERFCGNVDIFLEIRYHILYRVKALKRQSYKGF